MDNADCPKQTKQDRGRYAVALSVAIGLCMGLPIWWKTTEVYRAPLPKLHLEQSASLPAPALRVTLNVVLLLSTTNGSVEVESHLRHMLEILEQACSSHGGGGNFAPDSSDSGQQIMVKLTWISPTFCSEVSRFNTGSQEQSCNFRWESPPLSWADSSLHVQDAVLLPFADGLDQGSSAYTVFLVAHEQIEKDSQSNQSSIATVGKYRHAWVDISAAALKDSFEETVVPKVLQVAKHMVFGANDSGAKSTAGPKLGKSPGSKAKGKQKEAARERRRRRARQTSGPTPLAADCSALLSFSLLNAEPTDWVFDWDFAVLEEEVLQPLVHTIRPVADLTVESQVLYYARSQVRPTWDPQHQAYIVPHSGLPFFVNSHEWHLDTSVGAAGRSKLLHFVLYVPPVNECPLHLTLPNGKLSPTDGFTVPSWGGVVVWNPPQCLRNTSFDPSSRMLPTGELRKLVAIQIGQLRTLLGLPGAPKQSAEVHTLSPGTQGFAGWEVAALLRKRAAEDSREALSTLRSLSKLVAELSNLVVPDSIADQMKRALADTAKAQSAMRAGSYEEAAAAARRAQAQAETAFFHPTLMSLLYFPSEHHMAIYMPLFLPVLVNVCAALFRETLRWGRARCKRRLSEALDRAKLKHL